MRASVQSIGLLLPGLLAISCGGGGSSSGNGSGGGGTKPPDRLVFTLQPGRVEVGKAFPRSIRVTVQDENGKTVATANAAVSLSLVAPSNAKLLGSSTVNAVNGVAEFKGLRVDREGAGFTLRATAADLVTATSATFEVFIVKRHAIVMIADGWGYKHVEATRLYTGETPPYTEWTHYAMATWDHDTERHLGGRGYDPGRAWKDFGYGMAAATDSASAATAMFTGQKTSTGNISVAVDDKARLAMIGEIATARGIASGTVTTVPISHATPGAWMAHNNERGNTWAISDEGLFGHPNTTGTETKDLRWGGHWGPTLPGPDVVIGGGHPAWHADFYLNEDMLKKLRGESGQSGRWTLVERVKDQKDGGARLLQTARDPKVERLLGLFGGTGGNLEFRRADGKGHDAENPTLAEMTQAALAVLQRKRAGFTLMVEAGAVDWAGHGNLMNETLGEMIGFNHAVDAVIEWIEDPTNGSDWSNTLLIVTGDHECGYLTAGPGVFPNVALGEVSDRTLGLEKPYNLALQRASWEDLDKDGEIDEGEPVHWVWNSISHTNTLIPLWVKGVAADEFAKRVVAVDPVRGKYVENTAVFEVVLRALRL